MELIHHARALEKLPSNFVKKMDEFTYYKIITSPVGPLTLVATSHALLELSWGDNEASLGENSVPIRGKRVCDVISHTEKQLSEYFRKKRTSFDIPLNPSGTAFQKKVWLQLRKIPYGSVLTYGEQAIRLGAPKSARAVGAANGKNPISIIVPCHRVIGASGHLTGFAGGLEVKKALLELEEALR